MMVKRALLRGATAEAVITDNKAPWCSAPVEQTFKSPHGVSGVVGMIKTLLPCRKCKGCLRVRRKLWTRRSMFEWLRAERTWFATFTWHPQSAYRVRCLADKIRMDRSENGLQGGDWPALVAASGRDITLYLKRLRKAGLKFRYLAVAEPHKSGQPHWHMLIYCGNEVTKRALEAHWNEGFTQFRLVREDAQVLYATKYLAKDAHSRVRASLGFGVASTA